MEKKYEQFKLKWMLEHGHTLKELIDELEELLNTPWVHREFAKLKEAEHEREEGPEET